MKKRIAYIILLLCSAVSFTGITTASAAPAANSGVLSGVVGEPVTITEPESAAEQTEAAALPETAAETETAVQTPAALESPRSAAIGENVLEWNGYSAQLLRYRVNKFEHSDAAMYLFMRIINNTEKNMTLKLGSIEVDGTAVTGAGIYKIAAGTDTGENSEEYCLLVPDPDNAEAGNTALVNASEVKAIVTLKDSDSQEELYSQEVIMHLSEVSSERNVFEQSIVQGNDAPVTNPSASESSQTEQTPQYRTLQPGSRGEDVKLLQEKLIALGYLDDVADSSFGPNTAAAVKAFNEANGLTGGETADAATQAKAFSEDAVPYEEPLIPLTIASGFEMEAVPDNDAFFFRVQVQNISRERTIRGYELSVYMTDVWGSRLDAEQTEVQSITQKIGPGETQISGSLYLSDLKTVHTVWIGVSKVVFTDGEIREAENVVYYPCELPELTH